VRRAGPRVRSRQPGETISAASTPRNPQGGARAERDGAVAASVPEVMGRPDRYVLADRIGAGGMGTVWRAWDTIERRWVAAKLLASYDDQSTCQSLQRFVREQHLRVRHRHVVQPTDLVEGGFTMDLVRGGSVEQLLARHGPLPDAYVRVVLEQVLEALVAVHASGVVHRDLKPGNLLLEPTGTGRPWVRVSDFGVAAVVGDARLTRAPGGIGTGGYMPPEQEAGAEPDPRQDLYAAGVVAHQLLTGSVGSDAPAGPLGPLLACLTDPDPERRPPTAAAALAALRDLGVPRQATWPEVPDVLGDPPPPVSATRPVVATYARVAACFGGAALVGMLAGWLVVR
jgi:eukaryotic-like serine/threonine-protein kinase